MSRTRRIREHSEEVDTVFRIVSTHYTDVVYNELYAKAILIHQKEQKLGLTDCYSLTISEYISAIKSQRTAKEFLHMSINRIRALFDEYTKFNLFTLDDCFNKLTNAFLPPGFVQVADRTKMQTIIYNCLVGAISGTCNEIASSYLGAIIDDHRNHNNVRQITELFYEYFAMEREKMINKFISNKAKEGVLPVDVDLANRMRETNSLLEKRLESQIEKTQKYKAQVTELEQSVAKYEVESENLRKQQIKFAQQIAEYKSKILVLIRTIKELQQEVETKPTPLEFAPKLRRAVSEVVSEDPEGPEDSVDPEDPVDPEDREDREDHEGREGEGDMIQQTFFETE